MDFKKLTEYIVKKYNCHTIILYGSFAKDDFDAESDIDIVGFSNEDIEIQDRSFFEDRALDLWIYNDSKIDKPDEFIHIRSGRILLDNCNRAKDFLSKINVIFANGPKHQTYESKFNSICWLEKMLLRTQKNDLEGQYRFHWLLTDILPIYFAITDRWYLGSKESFVWLEKNDHEAYLLFKRMYSEPVEDNLKMSISFIKRKLKSIACD